MDVHHVSVGGRLQTGFHQQAELHAREVRRTLSVTGDFVFEPTDFLVVLFESGNHFFAVPEYLETELDFVLHLVQDVVERAVSRFEKFVDVLASAEYRSEGHGNHGKLAHDGFVHQFVGEHVFARRIVYAAGQVADYGGQVAAMDEIDPAAAFPYSNRSNVTVCRRLDDALDVLAFVAVASDEMVRRSRSPFGHVGLSIGNAEVRQASALLRPSANRT